MELQQKLGYKCRKLTSGTFFHDVLLSLQFSVITPLFFPNGCNLYQSKSHVLMKSLGNVYSTAFFVFFQLAVGKKKQLKPDKNYFFPGRKLRRYPPQLKCVCLFFSFLHRRQQAQTQNSVQRPNKASHRIGSNYIPAKAVFEPKI